MRRVRGDLELVFGQGLTNSRLLPDPDMLKYTFGHFQYYFVSIFSLDLLEFLSQPWLNDGET